MGGRLVLLQGVEGEGVQEWSSLVEPWCSSVFEKIRRWSPLDVAKERVICMHMRCGQKTTLSGARIHFRYCPKMMSLVEEGEKCNLEVLILEGGEIFEMGYASNALKKKARLKKKGSVIHFPHKLLSNQLISYRNKKRNGCGMQGSRKPKFIGKNKKIPKSGDFEEGGVGPIYASDSKFSLLYAYP
ncbi:unnamed protein product [Lupinus luteus]|uniref:Uncharacterized protein n=1 Tax=Lupinus luteus TaxID=3873 RepID=A0AAV1XAW7_LUPLU